MDDLMREFLTETAEAMGKLDVELVTLEQNPNDPTIIASIFRMVHTIKGTCGFLGLPRLESVAHASENVLGKFRDGAMKVTPAAVTLILEALDRIKDLLAQLEATEAEPAGDDKDLIKRLNDLAEGKAPVAAAPAPKPVAPPPLPMPKPATEESGGRDSDELQAIFDATPGPADAMNMGTKVSEQAPAAAAPAPSAEPEPAHAPEAPSPAAKAPAAAPSAESSVANQSIRVSVDLLENLMTMVSELVLTRNQLMQLVRSQHDSAFAVPLQRLSQVTTELQEGVMKTRMQPIGNAWAKLPRIVRDLSVELKKKIDLVMIGQETELDRQVLELIKDPLTHMVRNSGDHGLEVPEDRRKAGKPETGKIILKAYHEGGHIVILISDDGRGLPLDKIKAKAIQNGLATESQLASMSEQQIYQYIFKAGFSTATKVTSVSGRGVGMDVVRTNIEKIGGTVELSSVVGKGSTFTIKIPLTLAIVSALIVESGGERFAIPQIGVVELVRASKEGEYKIEKIRRTPVLRLRNRLLPLISLRDALKLGGEGEVPAEAFIVVSQVGNQRFGVIVDRVFDTEEIVVKPVAPLLREIDMFSGNTILGDGSVIMILDLNGVAAAMGDTQIREHEEKTEAEGARRDFGDGDRVALLVFQAGGKEPKAVPLALVARLEEIEVEKIEHTDGQMLVQYRGQLMPLITIQDGQKVRDTGRQSVVVFTDRNHSMGLVVDEIVDIVETRLKVEITSRRAGLLGSAVVAGKATEVIDAAHYLTQATADWFGSAASPFGETEAAKRVLIVDDSPFFRNMLEPVLKVAGYDVVAVEGADVALKLREAGESFDIIVSDIEMPNMNGFQFVENVRKGGSWKETPMIALSSYHSPRDMERGREAGFDDYIAKFDRDGLLSALNQAVAE